MTDQIDSYFKSFLNKSLTNKITIDLLYTLAESETPLSSTEIIRQMLKKSRLTKGAKKYVYEILNHLYPKTFVFDKNTSLFDLYKFIYANKNEYIKF